MVHPHHLVHLSSPIHPPSPYMYHLLCIYQLLYLFYLPNRTCMISPTPGVSLASVSSTALLTSALLLLYLLLLLLLLYFCHLLLYLLWHLLLYLLLLYYCFTTALPPLYHRLTTVLLLPYLITAAVLHTLIGEGNRETRKAGKDRQGDHTFSNVSSSSKVVKQW